MLPEYVYRVRIYGVENSRHRNRVSSSRIFVVRLEWFWSGLWVNCRHLSDRAPEFSLSTSRVSEKCISRSPEGHAFLPTACGRIEVLTEREIERIHH